MSAPKQKPEAVYLSTTCGYCDKKHGAYLNHYNILRTSCGRFLWSLKPKRNGPLVLFPWPGLHPSHSSHPSQSAA